MVEVLNFYRDKNNKISPLENVSSVKKERGIEFRDKNKKVHLKGILFAFYNQFCITISAFI